MNSRLKVSRIALVTAFMAAVSPLMGQIGRVRIVVTDTAGFTIPTAKSSLLGVGNSPTRTMPADAIGEIVWLNLPIGDSRFAVSAPGFKTRVLSVAIRSGDEVKIQTTLDVREEDITVIAAAPTLETTPPPPPIVAVDPPPNTHPSKRRHWLIFHW